MKRIIMMVLRNILLVPWMWAKLCYHASHVDKYTEEEIAQMKSFCERKAAEFKKLYEMAYLISR